MKTGFSHKKLLRWRIGHLIIEVVITDNFKEQLDTEEKEEIGKKDLSGMYAVDENKIFIHPDVLKSPEAFLATLFHELWHVRKYLNGVDELITLKEKCKNGFYEIEELECQLDTMRLMDMIADNLENFRYIVNYFKERK